MRHVDLDLVKLHFVNYNIDFFAGKGPLSFVASKSILLNIDMYRSSDTMSSIAH